MLLSSCFALSIQVVRPNKRECIQRRWVQQRWLVLLVSKSTIANRPQTSTSLKTSSTSSKNRAGAKSIVGDFEWQGRASKSVISCLVLTALQMCSSPKTLGRANPNGIIRGGRSCNMLHWQVMVSTPSRHLRTQRHELRVSACSSLVRVSLLSARWDRSRLL